jgi:hypothetical protein
MASLHGPLSWEPGAPDADVPGARSGAIPGAAGKIRDVTVRDGRHGHWSVQAGLAPGALAYGDRQHTIHTIPPAVRGLPWLRAAQDSKRSKSDPLITFALTSDAQVFVALDDRAAPLWLDESWHDTGEDLVIREQPATQGATETLRRSRVFTRKFPAGSVALGPYDQANVNMYVVMVK